ncbi:MAG: Crp/Fnr family transcriptional regulator [Alphaproteobacteria bacterium]|nr:Crp/Fnr family transcriptional regulator [Alphaproteobacteria bacterium]
MTTDKMGFMRRFASDEEQDPVVILERKFEQLIDLSEVERDVLRDLHLATSVTESRRNLVKAGDRMNEIILVLDGWVARYKMLADGRRQIVAFLLPGDFIDLYAALFEQSDDSFLAVTEVTYASIPPERLLELFREHPRLAALLCWSAGEVDAILSEHIVRIGRRSAFERVGHLLLELYIRLDHVGLADDRGYDFPLTQEIIADALGLSLVHVNRTMRRLRDNELVEARDEFLHIVDLQALVKASRFDRNYLENRNLPESLLARLLG